MRKLIFTSAMLMTFACAKNETAQEVTANTNSAEQAKPAAPAIKEISISSNNAEALEQFQKGRELAENARPTEAAPYFAKALELDPTFALAEAKLGEVTPGADGLKHLEQAANLAANLPEDERLLIDLALAKRRGDEAKVDELQQKLVEIAPTDWRVYDMAASRALMKRDLDGATTALKKAAELNPKAGEVFNHLGYALLLQGKKDEAVDAFKKYAELSPTEPNPHDSLADALLASGKLEEAEASYLKATEVAPTFFFAWNGVAQTRALRGNWAGAEEALTKARDGATEPAAKLEGWIDIAWLTMSQNKPKDALKMLDEIEKQAETDKVEMVSALIPIERAAMLVESGKPKDALKLIDTGFERAEKAGLPGGQMTHLRSFGLHVRALAEARLAKKDDVAKTAALFEEEVKKNPGNGHLVSALHDVQGLVAIANGDSKAALEAFASCTDDDAICAMHRVEAEEKAGNKPVADQIRERLTATPSRDVMYLYARSKLGTLTAN